MKGRRLDSMMVYATCLIVLLLIVAATDGKGAIVDDGYRRLDGRWYDSESRIIAVKNQTPFVNCSDGVTSYGYDPASGEGLFQVPDGVSVFYCRDY